MEDFDQFQVEWIREESSLIHESIGNSNWSTAKHDDSRYMLRNLVIHYEISCCRQVQEVRQLS